MKKTSPYLDATWVYYLFRSPIWFIKRALVTANWRRNVASDFSDRDITTSKGRRFFLPLYLVVAFMLFEITILVTDILLSIYHIVRHMLCIGWTIVASLSFGILTGTLTLWKLKNYPHSVVYEIYLTNLQMDIISNEEASKN